MNIAIAQSGGPTCAINASLLGVFNEAAQCSEIEHIYGSLNGIEGIIKNNLVDLKEIIKTEEDKAVLRQTPATVLGSCRYKLPEYSSDSAVYKAITENLLEHNVKAFFYIGGNDSMDTVAKLSAYMKKKDIDIKVIGVPKTIDNDLYITDHTPGFGSAAKFVTTTLSEIVRDSAVYDLDSVTIVEIMGRNAGWLAASTCILHNMGEAPHLIYLPEREFVIENFINDVKAQLKKHRSVIVAISEGVQVGKRARQKTDCFGHLELAGVGKQLENLIIDVIGCKVRSVELNVLQRCASHISSKTDIDEAEMIGSAAVKAALDGQSGKMMCFKRVGDRPYRAEIISADAAAVANREKPFPNEWINSEGNNVNDEAIPYFLPLIEGENPVKTQNGLPMHFVIK